MAQKRAVIRALRHFFLWGWVYYHGQLIDRAARLTAFFPHETISTVRSSLRSDSRQQLQHTRVERSQVKSQLDPLLCDGKKEGSRRGFTLLKLLTYNCRTLGDGSRLTELAEDLAARDIQVAALQGTCWKHTSPRSEWTVRDRHGRDLYHCFAWGKPQKNPQLGVLLLLQAESFQLSDVRHRFDPGKGNVGRLGGVRVVERGSSRAQDHTFFVAYAPGEDAAAEVKHTFYAELHQHLEALPARTSVWLLGDFNAHVGAVEQFRSVGQCDKEDTNENGIYVASLCQSHRMFLTNTFHAAGHTWWAPQGSVSHRLDYIAAQTSYRRAVQKCKVNGFLGQRWQTSTVRDHWPVELHVRLRHEIRYKARRAGVRWNRHAVCRLSTDVPLREAFLRDAAAVIAPFEAANVSDTLDLQEAWTACQTRRYEVSQRHFGMPAQQRNSKTLPATFALLQSRRELMQSFLQARDAWKRSRRCFTTYWSARVCFSALRLHARTEQASRAVKHDNRLQGFLYGRLDVKPRQARLSASPHGLGISKKSRQLKRACRLKWYNLVMIFRAPYFWKESKAVNSCTRL